MHTGRIFQLDNSFSRLRKNSDQQKNYSDTVAGKAVGFAHEQPLHVVALACSAFRILKRLQQNVKVLI
jgi:formiminotetrahydrofolate cyclodeaminase